MTIISTANPVSLEEALDIAEQRAFEKRTPAFPPVADTIAWFNSVDWADVRQRCRAGVNNCGLVIAVIGEKVHDLRMFSRKSMNYRVTILAQNGYQSQKVEVRDVTTQAKAKEIVKAQYPGCRLGAVIPFR